MVVRAAVVALIGLAFAGCAASGPPAPPAAEATSSARDPAFATTEARMMACLDLCDHIVALYADEYVAEQGVDLDGTARARFRKGWGEQLARQGTFDRFEQTCFYGLTPSRYRCGMQSTTTDGLTACMRLSSR